MALSEWFQLGVIFFQTSLINATESAHRNVAEFRDRDHRDIGEVVHRLDALLQGFNQSVELLESDRMDLLYYYFVDKAAFDALIVVS